MESRKCFGCGQTGHLRRDCPNIGTNNSEPKNTKCFACGEEGHFRSCCPNGASERASVRNSNGAQSSVDAFLESENEFVDTHCHLEYLFDRQRHHGGFSEYKAKHHFPKSFKGCITMFCDPAAFSSFGSWQDLVTEDGVWGAFGCHPHNSDYYTETMESKIIECLKHPKAVALGECGLDYSKRSKAQPSKQAEVFVRQMKLAVELKKPLIIHCRNAESDTLDLLKSSMPTDWKIHLHCYTGSVDFAQKFLHQFSNLYIGLTGIVTSSNARDVQNLARQIPLDRLLLETDAPYFVPSKISKSHKWAHPGMAIYVAEAIADIKEIPFETVLEVVRNNTKHIYGI